jgi:hypothetical protein
MQQNYVVSPEFKTQVSEILNTKKFTAVFPYMNLINREGNTFTESEMNSIVQFIGEFPYQEVAEFFAKIPQLAKPIKEEAPANSIPSEEPVTETAE